MRVSLATRQGSGSANEDWALTTPELVVVIDGVTAPEDMGTGCSHGTPWYVQHLAARVVASLTERPSCTLNDTLGRAIRDVAAMHTETCDLDHLGTPSATVALLRERGRAIDYLVLADSVIVLDSPEGPEVISDERVQAVATKALAATREHRTGSSAHRKAMVELIREQRRYRNQPEGYWLAATDPAAAAHAITGSVPREGLRLAAVLTDGASRLVDVLGIDTWSGALKILEECGPEELIRRVREAEDADPEGERWPRFKRSDDATAALCLFDPPSLLGAPDPEVSTRRGKVGS